MKEILIAFDVDGTLISNTNGIGIERLNIDIYQMMVLLGKMKNTRIIVWSGGGKEYAEQIVTKYGLDKFVDGCYGKIEYDESIYGTVDVCFDDQHATLLAEKNIIVRTK